MEKLVDEGKKTKQKHFELTVPLPPPLLIQTHSKLKLERLQELTRRCKWKLVSWRTLASTVGELWQAGRVCESITAIKTHPHLSIKKKP